MYAHYFNKSKQSGGKPFIMITQTPKPTGGMMFIVKGLKDAREMAAAFNAKPWNF